MERGKEEEPLSSIIGEQLSSVEFVQDYVQLRFDGPWITAITLPTVLAGNVLFKPNMPGYRDALCERIGKRVSSTSVREGVEIRIGFEDDASISISLAESDYGGSEAAVFENRQKGICYVWDSEK